MREELLEILSKNRPQLVENIDPEHGILNDLLAQNVFTRRQAKTIEVMPDPFRQVEAILDNLRRRPDEDFNKFCNILCKHGQDEVVEKYLKPQKPASSEIDDDEKHSTGCKSQVLTSGSIQVRKSTREFYDQYKQSAYPMCNQFRGKCVIFNVETVRGMARREGTERDLQNLRSLFTTLHFCVEAFTDPTAKDITDKMQKIATDPGLEQDQCLVLFVLSHGRVVTTMTRHGVASIEHIYGSDGLPVKTEDILDPITNVRCPAMRGKPKLVFFQACREVFKVGSLETDAVATDAVCAAVATTISSTSSTSSSSSYAISAASASSSQPPISFKDFVVGYSTESGYLSFREVQSGSWYVDAIVRVFSEFAHEMDLCAMLRKVNGIIADQWPTGSAVDNSLRQVATHIDSLTKPYLFFFPGIVTES